MNAPVDAVDPRVEALGYRLFDADNHYYEAEDAFLRYLDPKVRHKAPRWVTTDDGGKRLIFGDRLNRFMGSDHTFDPIGRPGVLLEGNGYGELEPIRPEYRHRAERLALMNRQGLEATMLFPTLAVSVEQLLIDDVEATYANLHAFNRWLDDDWGINHHDRVYGVPMLSLLDPSLAVEELEFVLDRGARVVNLRPGPIAGHAPSDRIYDGFWARVHEADVAVTFHAADDAYRYDLARVWGWGNPNVPARNIPPIQRIVAGFGRPIHDTLATLVYGKLFERFPGLRIATVELACGWVAPLLHNMKLAGKSDLKEDPVETFRRHVWVNPYSNEDIGALAEAVGTDRILFGSDYPHTDGLPDPVLFVDSLAGFSADDVRKIMHDNAREFVRPT
ncbi:MAG: amidohydrolase family protein [Acidimicrobiia bacterium]